MEQLLVVTADVLHDHPAPVRPVVRPAVPDAERVTDPAIPQLAGKIFAVPAHLVVAPDGEDDVEPARIAALQRLNIILAIGRDDQMRGNSEYFSGKLWDRGIGNALRIWDGWAHDWPYWRRMITQYIGGHD